MDSRVILLKEFYSTMQKDKLKIESNCYGFDLLDGLLSQGIKLEYGELTSSLIHKYKLVNISEDCMADFLQGHINKHYNACLYFNEIANNILCFNLDNNFKENNTELIPEMQYSVNWLTEYLTELEIEPLVIVSGRGYHVWCRLDAPVDNKQLHKFMLQIVAKTMEALHVNGYDYNRVKFNMYPNNEIINTVSLRFFGSEHVKNKIFSYVYTNNGVLEEDASWRYFTEYLKHKTISKDQFMQIANELARYFSSLDTV